MRTGPIQRHYYYSCMQVSEKHAGFLRLLLTFPVKMSPEVLCYPEHSSGQEILQAQLVSILLIPKEKWPPCPLRCYEGRGSWEDAYLQRQGDLPVGLQCLQIPQLYHRAVPALWVLYGSSSSESRRGHGMMKDDSLILSPHNSHSLWVASDALLTEESYDRTKSLRHICPKCQVINA